MSVKFDRKAVDLARTEFYRVYVDKITDAEIIASETAYKGDRIRIYTTDWFYEGEQIFRSNREFKAWFRKYLDDMYYGLEDIKPALA